MMRLPGSHKIRVKIGDVDPLNDKPCADPALEDFKEETGTDEYGGSVTNYTGQVTVSEARAIRRKYPDYVMSFQTVLIEGRRDLPDGKVTVDIVYDLNGYPLPAGRMVREDENGFKQYPELEFYVEEGFYLTLDYHPNGDSDLHLHRVDAFDPDNYHTPDAIGYWGMGSPRDILDGSAMGSEFLSWGAVMAALAKVTEPNGGRYFYYALPGGNVSYEHLRYRLPGYRKQ